LFRKCIFYIVDEPGNSEQFAWARNVDMEIYNAKMALKGLLDAHPALQASFLNIGHLVTAVTGGFFLEREYEGDTLTKGGVGIWCPFMYYLDSAADRGRYLDRKYNGKTGALAEDLWWYTCVVNSPFPSYLIDSIPMNMRTASWMQYDYDVTGTLYWCANLYGSVSGLPRDVWIDPSPNNYDPCNGEGQLLYPGARYGMKKPISTIRLEQLLGGQQDYEIFYLLDLELNGTSYSAREIVSELGKKVYFGTELLKNASERVLEDCRLTLLGILDDLANGKREAALETVASIIG